MQIAVLSGKGGTGKTLLSVNLSRLHPNSIYVDCDVEEPNGLVYYKIKDAESEYIYTGFPVVDHDTCIGCEKCTNFCRFNALGFILDKVRVFRDLCHDCGGCEIICPVDAISEDQKELGKIVHGHYEHTEIYSGQMNVKEESGVPIISALLDKVENSSKTVFIDSPPGNGCLVMESIQKADYCILVAEPTIFGLHNLKMVYELTKLYNKKIGLVINKSENESLIHDFANSENINILGEIPMDLNLGKLNSNGEFAVDHEAYKPMFETILTQVKQKVIL